MEENINFEILNSFVNIVFFDVAQKYIVKLKKEQKNPPPLIEDYLDNSVYLLNKYQTIEILKMKNTIANVDKKEQKQFEELFKEDAEYEQLCKELNFAYLLIVDEDLQEKTISLIYNNIYEYKILINQDLITKKQVSISRVMEESNKKKINKLHNYNSYDSKSLRAN